MSAKPDTAKRRARRFIRRKPLSAEDQTEKRAALEALKAAEKALIENVPEEELPIPGRDYFAMSVARHVGGSNKPNTNHIPLLSVNSRLAPRLQDTFCRLLATGMPLRSACKFTGIVPSKVFEWLKQGEVDLRHCLDRRGYNQQFVSLQQEVCIEPCKDCTPQCSFKLNVDHAIAKAEFFLLQRVQLAGIKDWRASMRLLELRWARQHGRSESELGTKDQGASSNAISVQVAVVTPPQAGSMEEWQEQVKVQLRTPGQHEVITSPAHSDLEGDEDDDDDPEGFYDIRK